MTERIDTMFHSAVRERCVRLIGATQATARDTIRRELKSMNVVDVPYLVLSRGPERFLQAALFDEVGWVLERRLEGDAHPWVCTDPLKRREVAEAFIAFREGDEGWARKLSWEPGV